MLCVLWVALYRFIALPGGIYMASEAWQRGGIKQDWRSIEEISPRLARAVMAAEDARFCDHYGFDFEAIRAAIRLNEQGKRTYGASTITQQTAKNVFLWHQRSWVRKGLEAGFTVLIELLWPKQRTLEVYLNTAEFAPGVFGAEAASQHHFGRPAAALTLTQASRLAAVLPNPKTRSASRPSAFVKRRARRIAAGAQTLKVENRDRCVLG
jgi:monofunctional biosynthetic peptidoglycan transglycosylase